MDAVVISIFAFTPNSIRNIEVIEKIAVISFLKKAVEHNMRRIIYISTYDLNKQFVKKYNIKSTEIKLEIEEYIKKSNLNWIIIGAVPSMEIFFSMIKGKIMVVPGGRPVSLTVIAS